MAQLLEQDIDHIIGHTAHLWENVRGKSIFLTGGTGFVGSWLLESFLAANERFALNAELTLLSRDPNKFLARHDYLDKRTGLSFLEGELASFQFPKGDFEFVIHAATEQGKPTSRDHPLGPFDDNIVGARHVLDFVSQASSRRVLFTSSGAVYGVQPPTVSHLSEDENLAPSTSDPMLAYGHSKRACEFMGCAYAAAHGFDLLIARLFAFVGPRLPLHLNFAAGNFIGDALQGRAINIAGDGTTVRSYLYAADMTIWLWTILFQGVSGRPYNVGSNEPVSIFELARVVRNKFDDKPDINLGRTAIPGSLPARYVPSTERAQTELGLAQWISIDEGVHRMAEWYTQNKRD